MNMCSRVHVAALCFSFHIAGVAMARSGIASVQSKMKHSVFRLGMFDPAIQLPLAAVAARGIADERNTPRHPGSAAFENVPIANRNRANRKLKLNANFADNGNPNYCVSVFRECLT